MIIDTKLGGRRVELYIPFELDGSRVDAVTFGPWKFDYTLGWREGRWSSILALMVELADVDEKALRELRAPDDSRVSDAFMSLLPAEVREDVAAQVVPLPPDQRQDLEAPLEQPQGSEIDPHGLGMDVADGG